LHGCWLIVGPDDDSLFTPAGIPVVRGPTSVDEDNQPTSEVPMV
jgi:hypothetical protein